MSDGAPEKRLTSTQADLLRRSLRTADGNPWPTIGMVERKGGAKSRMFDVMKKAGLFDAGNCITPAGREAIAAYDAARKR